MSACASPIPPPVMTPEAIGLAVTRLWKIRQVIRDGAFDRSAIVASLAVLASLPHRSVARLALQTIDELAPGLPALLGLISDDNTGATTS